jgi:protein-L-isoaspartate O-methyltransferase
MKLSDITTRVITHERDVEYFTEYPAPIMELIHCSHFTNINSTIPFFGPMLYFLARAMGVEQVLEIGHAECYTAWYLANAVKDNATRFGMAGNRYYGIDIVQTEKARENLKDLPATIINMDSMLLTPDTFKDIKFDLIFQDGCHDTEHVLHELKTLYPQLKGEGRGFFICHDTCGPAEEGFREIQKLIKEGVYDFQYVVIPEIYGIAIMRKMTGYDYEKRHWTNG